MRQPAIIYLHGFKSASLDVNGDLLTTKEKLVVMQDFCMQKSILFTTPNVDFRDFSEIVEDMLTLWNQYLDQGYEVTFMGSSMGGFSSEYLAMKTGCKAIMINPAISPSTLLPQFIGVNQNFETGQLYHWSQAHCDQYLSLEQEIANCKQPLSRTIFLDLEDELIDAKKTLDKYQHIANVVSFEGGSHSFEHIKQALPVIEQTIFN